MLMDSVVLLLCNMDWTFFLSALLACVGFVWHLSLARRELERQLLVVRRELENSLHDSDVKFLSELKRLEDMLERRLSVLETKAELLDCRLQHFEQDISSLRRSLRVCPPPSDSDSDSDDMF